MAPDEGLHPPIGVAKELAEVVTSWLVFHNRVVSADGQL